ncbi:hypothetical protein AN958_02332 [Leucoagaricus sp. SymC.cos]|nr:hypothetical protein AN958_02332 [Leucoagaricus sp. SymC.cos]
MSFLNLIGGGRRTPAPARPITATSNAEVTSQLSNPTRQGSVDSLTPGGLDKKHPSRAQTDSVSLTSRAASPSRSSSTEPSKKPFIGRPSLSGATRILSSSLRSSPATSKVSLVETVGNESKPQPSLSQDGARLRMPSIPLAKASPSLEQEWMEVDKDSSDEDDFISDNDDPASNEQSRKDDQKSSKHMNESIVLVEDEQLRARRLAGELAVAQEKLAELRKQHAGLQKQLAEAERDCKERDSQLKVLKEANDANRIKSALDHAAAMEIKRRELQDFQKSLEVLQRESKVWEEKVEMLSRENEVLRKEVAELEEQCQEEQQEIESTKREVEAANTALRTFKERSKTLITAEREEYRNLKQKADDLERQLEALEKHSRERDEQLQQLQATSESTDSGLRVAQAAAAEKDKALYETQRRIASLEKQRDKLQERIAEMETEAVEAKNAAQRLLARAKEDQCYENSQASDRIRSLENDLSSSSTTIQQLRNSLKASLAEAEGITKLSESRAAEIENLQQQLNILEEDLHSKEQELIDANATHVSRPHLEAKINHLNTTIEQLRSDHSIDRHHLQVEATKERARGSQLEKDVTLANERIRELRSRLEISEQNRRMLRDQLTRRDEEAHRSRSSTSSSGSGSSIFNLSSSIINDPTQPSTDQLFSLLQNLNYEIFQTAALLTDSLCTIPRPSSPNTNTTDLIDEEATSLLGAHLLSLVRSQSTTPLDSYDPYPLQTAIQATLICCATRSMTAWYPGHWDHSDFLAATYARIREVEGIAASDTWKAMTRARLRPTTATVVRVVDFIDECLDTIFRYAGWPGAASAAVASSSSSTAQSVLRENREKLSALARHSLRLNVLLDSVTPQLEPAFVEPGSVFDPYMMDRDDTSQSGSRSPDEDDDEVISTSEIGLRKALPEGRGSSSSRRRIVLRPKVILKSSFDD